MIYEALLMPAIDHKDEIAVLEEGKQQVVDESTHKFVTQGNYHIVVIRRTEQNG